ncbi:MAG: hypothetical protein PHN39_03520 [Candidatus Pacebacteria bacterium]|nr:hypothetical protein [Candidatus Paceibacterota bacterium]
MTLTKIRISEILIALLFVAVGISLRLLPHPPNFAPIAALALFSGVYLPKALALSVPMASMLISDIFLGFYEWQVSLAVYGSFFLCVFLGRVLSKRKRWPLIVGSSLVGSLVFFLTTNLAIWAFTPWYAKTFAGLINCFFLALPFFRSTLLGDLFYTITFFGLYGLVNDWFLARQKKAEEAAIQNP